MTAYSMLTAVQLNLQQYISIFNKLTMSLCFNWAPRHEGEVGEWRYNSRIL